MWVGLHFAILERMKSRVAEAIKQDQREEILALSAEERILLSLALGDRCVRIFAEAQNVSIEEAKSHILARRSSGRE